MKHSALRVALLVTAGLLVLGACSSPAPQIDQSEEGGDFMNQSAENLEAWGTALDQWPAKTQTATFAMGWFWGPDARFGQLSGVLRTRVGYAGGETANPTYQRIGDHTETIEIEFDPEQISFEELLEYFWEWHNPMIRSWARQYQSILFYHDETQKEAVESFLQQKEETADRQVYTWVRPMDAFYTAENYHQKYYLQNRQMVFDSVRQLYPTIDVFFDSTTAARLNAYVMGFGTAGQLEKDLEMMQLPEEVERQVRAVTDSYF